MLVWHKMSLTRNQNNIAGNESLTIKKTGS